MIHDGSCNINQWLFLGSTTVQHHFLWCMSTKKWWMITCEEQKLMKSIFHVFKCVFRSNKFKRTTKLIFDFIMKYFKHRENVSQTFSYKSLFFKFYFKKCFSVFLASIRTGGLPIVSYCLQSPLLKCLGSWL